MTLRGAIVVILGIIAVCGVFVGANRAIVTLFGPTDAGLTVPLWPQLVAYTAALLLGVLICWLVIVRLRALGEKAIKIDREDEGVPL
jgi:ABC-type antimicrobial peptide transport system permease subunit